MRTTLALLLVAALSFAAPAPPQMIVNSKTMECSAFFAGDECTRCAVPEGWTSLGVGTTECPEGYAETTVEAECTPSESQMCCSAGHSGAMGECGRMMINREKRQCMFTNKTAQAGWETQGGGSGGSSWECPEGYAWTDEQVPSETVCAAAALLFGAAVLILRSRA